MTTAAPFIVIGLIGGLGLWVLLYELAPRQPHMQDALDRLSSGQIDLRHDISGSSGLVAPAGSLAERLGARINRAVGHLKWLSAPDEDLALLAGIGAEGVPSRSALYARKLTYAMAGLLITSVFVLAARAAGASLAIALPAIFGPVFAALGWMLPDSKIKKQAEEAREEFRRVAVAYLRLIAIRRTASGGAVDAMMGAAELADTWPFQRIRAELVRAQWAKIPMWDALGQLGEQVGVHELAEIGDIMRMAGESDAAVAESLLARANSLREQMLVNAQGEATAATASMAIPRTLLLVLTFVALLYPVALQLVATGAG